MIDGQVEAFALDAADKPVKFRETDRMKRLNKGQLPYNEEDYILHCILSKNYRMLFAYMNYCGYNYLSFETVVKIPTADVLAIFPQGCFRHILVSERPNTTCIDTSIIYCWLFGKIGDVVAVLFKATLYMNLDFKIISNLGDLKRHPLQLIKEILRHPLYYDVIIRETLNLHDDSRFLGQTMRKDFTAIRKDVIKLVNGFLRLLDPYLSFYIENNQSHRLAFIGWSLPQLDFNYFSQYDHGLQPFRTELFDFGPLPTWSKLAHLQYPLAFKKQVKTCLLMKIRSGNIVNRLLHKDLFSILFQYMAFNSLLVEEEEIKYGYRCIINVSHREDQGYDEDMRCFRKRQRTIE